MLIGKKSSCHVYVPVSKLIYAAFRSNAKGLCRLAMSGGGAGYRTH
jgi:hypothetical protein